VEALAGRWIALFQQTRLMPDVTVCLAMDLFAYHISDNTIRYIISSPGDVGVPV